ncbi:MAG: ABC transporter permease [Thaumarchaeota archaeon]|nr:ABC transporter permease [Nitrososphaerota archaeon]
MKLVVVFKAVTRNWLRSRSGLFFSFLFPVLLLLLLASVSSTPGVPGPAGLGAGYYVASVTAAFVMTNGVIGLTNVGSELRRNGVLKRLSASPLPKFEWLLGNILSQAVLALILAGVMLALGAVLFRAEYLVNFFSIAILVMGTLLFSGLGMTLAGVIKDPETASGVGNAIAFPMMLLSGTFWPISAMPAYLQSVAAVLPLTFFSEGLRDSLVVANFQIALTDLVVVTAFAVAFLLIGTATTKWSEP